MAPKQNEKILVVDGDPDVVSLIADQVLSPLGYHVASAQDGSAALQLILQMAPDILITALDLPGLSGRDLLTAMHSRGLETIIVATGPRGAESQAMQAFRLGAKDYLSKPVREAEVVASVDRALSEVRLRRERTQLAERLASANQQLEKRVKELTTLASIGKAVTAITTLSQLFTRLLEAGMFVTEAEVGWLLVSDDNSGKPILRAAKNLPSSTGTIKLNQPWDDGITPLLMLSGEALTLSGAPLARLRAGQVVKSVVAVPLKARDAVVGVLVVGSKSGRPFTERDQAMLSAVADYAVVAMINGRLFSTMEARVQTLQATHDELMKTNTRRENEWRQAGEQLRAPLVQARGALEHLARGQVGALSAQQAQALAAALDRLTAAQRLIDDLAAPPQPAARSGDTAHRP
jgi:two-component system NtrC family sensor kinase